jgi:hypothetical protein
VNRIFKTAIATRVSTLLMGLAIAYVPDLRVKTMLTFRRAANIVGLVDWDPVEEGRAAAQRGDFVAQDYAVGMSSYRKAADPRNARAQLNLGRLYANGVPPNYAAAASWFSVAAGSGNSDAQRFLGEMCAQGAGCPTKLCHRSPVAKLGGRERRRGGSRTSGRVGHENDSGTNNRGADTRARLEATKVVIAQSRIRLGDFP